MFWDYLLISLIREIVTAHSGSSCAKFAKHILSELYRNIFYKSYRSNAFFIVVITIFHLIIP
jgi:hypothetical protein